MRVEERIWQALTVAVGLLTALIPAYVAYDLYGRGPVPEKRMELTRFSPINPMTDLAALGDKVSLSLTVERQTINNLVIAKAFLRNVGSTPIVPTDFHENLSVNVDKRWKIVAVENDRLLRNVELQWKRISDTRFEARPTLLNPGDLVSATVYLTDTQYSGNAAGDKTPEPTVEWRARIVNLRAFYEPPSFMERMERRGFSWVEVSLSGWALPFTIVAALLFQALYLHLLHQAGFMRRWGWRSIVLVVSASLLSFAAAESSATYLFGSRLTEIVGIPHSINAPWIILHVVVLAFLYTRARARLRNSRALMDTRET